jgi:hypothetical protein
MPKGISERCRCTFGQSYWVDDVEERGLEEVRKIPGWHDEPLKGERKGQRSISEPPQNFGHFI